MGSICTLAIFGRFVFFIFKISLFGLVFVCFVFLSLGVELCVRKVRVCTFNVVELSFG